MSNALAIAATTLTLRSLLNDVATADYSGLPLDARPVNQIDVTTLPPDQARLPDAARSRVNLFLYHIELNAAWRNMDLPRQVRPGERAPPALPLNLHYLVTVYAENDNELIGQVLLGMAMRILHDHPVLSREEINTALALSELDVQVERVRITAQPFSLDDLSKLWSGFQSDYRLSAGYQVGVLLIESQRPLRAALPVLRRGATDRGPLVVAAPAPSLLEVEEFFDPSLPMRPRHGKPAADLGDVIVLRGANLGADAMIASLRHDRRDTPLTLPLEDERDDTTVRVALPLATDADVPENWPAGFYTIELQIQRPSPPNWTTNRLSFALAPRITSLNPASQPAAAQPFDLTITCTPQILAEQRVVLLLGDREFLPSTITPPADSNSDSSLQVPVNGLEAGDYVARLRVDGVDSIPIDFLAAIPRFDPAQTVAITP